MSIQRMKLHSTYPDAPDLAKKLLIPALDEGMQINLVSAFAPSYIFGVIRELASRKTSTSGYLHLTLFVKGDLRLKSEGIARFKHYLGRFADSEVQVAQFIEDCLFLLTEENGNSFELSLLHADQKKAPTKSLFGAIYHEDSWPEMVTFVDAKAGDFNSPITPKRSWENDEYLEGLDIYTRISALSRGEKGSLVGQQEIVSWLEYLSDWYSTNPPVVVVSDDHLDDASEQLDDVEIFEIEGDFIEFLQDFGEFQKETDFEYDDQDNNEFDWDDWFEHGGREAEVFHTEAVNGHIPPLSGAYNASVVGSAKSTCVCGQVFTRIHGCSKVDW
jgi:hypothetical protein